MARQRTQDILLKLIAKTADASINIAGSFIAAFYCKEFYSETGFSEAVSESALRNAVRRLKEKGCLEKIEKKGKVYYRITERGRNKIEKTLFDRELWDGEWRIVMFDIPEEKKRTRDSLRTVLRASSFKHFQKSVWITPFDVLDEVEEFVNEKDLHNNVWYFKSNSLKNDESIIEMFLGR